MANQGLVLYENTPANAWRIGWVRVEEYCFGDLKSAYVVHDHVTGRFLFTNEPFAMNAHFAAKVEEPKQASCGCCSCGCVCFNHLDIPRGLPIRVCAYHRTHPPVGVVPTWAAFVAKVSK